MKNTRKLLMLLLERHKLRRTRSHQRQPGNILTDSVNKMIQSGYTPAQVNIRSDGRGVQGAGDYLDGSRVNHNLVGGRW